MNSLRAWYLVTAVLGSASAAFAETIEVKQDGTGDYTAIQAAIDAVQFGDEILVYPGTYFEHLVIENEDFDIRSFAGPYATTIAAETTGAIVYFGKTALTTNTIEGFTIRGAFGGPKADGIFIEVANVTVRNCIIRNNEDEGLKVGNAESAVGVTTLVDCLIVENGHGTFPAGWGIAIQDSEATAIITNCTVALNGQGILSDYNATVILTASIVSGQWDRGVYALHGATMTTECSDISLNDDDRTGVPFGPGDFVFDPLFCEDLDEFFLRPESPCLPGNHPDGIDCGLIGARPECAVVGVPATSMSSTALAVEPSPAHETVRFTFQALGTASDLHVFDVSGRRVASIGIAAHKRAHAWDATNAQLTPGVYFARRTIPGGRSESTRFIIVN